MTLYEKYEFYKKIQNTKYDKTDEEVKNILQSFRKELGKFTDKIFHGFEILEKGQWQNSGTFTKYMWNRYKPHNDDSSLVVYFNASARKDEGLFLSVGLVDDKLSEFEKKNKEEIYNFIEEKFKQIKFKGFEKSFRIIDQENFEFLEYDELIQGLKEVYFETYNKFYNQENNYWLVGSKWEDIDKTEEFIINGIWENGFEDKYFERVNSIEVGDKIAIKSSYVKTKNLPFENEGKSVSVMRIKAIGTVLENPKNGKTIKVDWNLDFRSKEIYGFSYRNTISIIDKEKWRNPISWIFDNKDQDDFFSFNEFKNEENEDFNMNKSLNQILYGPPGTGKTYNTINKAIEIIENRTLSSEELENRKALKDKFEEYKKAGQIEFVTFHQSYGYEEFIEGIKADLESNEIKYKLEKGIFKKLSSKAKENFENSKKTTEQLAEEKTVKQKLEIFLNDSLENEIEFLKTKGGKFKIKELNQDDIALFAQDSNYNDQTVILQIEEFLKIISSDIELKSSKQMAKDVFGLNNQRQRDTYYFSMYNEFKKIKFENMEEVKNEEPLKNYILIIDEINRGNISKIFGELITLIEPSKRIGADEEIKLKLPYSNEEFGVPLNLHILGTMNTADRSIALMDTALRRRFEFIEMMPDLEVLKDLVVEDIKIKKLLETINKRIEYLYDRDHTIGHAYFMSLETNPSLEELDGIFRNKIIPLLQEYFYDDWEKILMVLGENTFIEKMPIKSDIFDYKVDDYLEEEKFVYSVKKDFDYSKFR